MGIIIGLLLLAGVIGVAIHTFVVYEETDKLNIVELIIAIVLALALITVPLSIHQVNAGEVAVVKHLGKAVDVRTAGLHFDFWIANKYEKYDGKVQNVEIETATYSSDAQTMDIFMTLQYSVMTDKAVDICNHYGSLKVLENRITSIATEKVKAVLSQHKAMDIIANRAEMSPMVEDAIKEAVGEDYYVMVNTVVLTNIDFSDAFETAVEDKMIAEQNKLKAEYENERKVAQAKADAEASVAQAEADAKATLLKAEAEAEANRLKSESMTDKILESKFYEKWNGQLPQVMGENSAITDIRSK